MFKWIARVLIGLIALPVLAAGMYTGWNWIRLWPDQAVIDYLNQNATAIDLSSEQAFALAKEDLDARLVLLGEVHGIGIGQELDFAMLRMLNKEKGVRYYLGEFDPAQAAEFNAYLESGDERHLRKVFAFWLAGNAQWANQEFMEKIRKIRALNEGLPEKRKIAFIGMDRVQDMPLMATHLENLLASLPDASWSGQQVLSNALLREDGRTENTATAPLVLAAAEVARDMPFNAPENIDPVAWASLREAIFNLSDRGQLKGREAAITAAFERLAGNPNYAGEAFYGFWGQFHVLHSTVQGSKPFVRQLQEGKSSFAGEILSLSILNLDSRMMLPAASFGSPDPYIEIPYSLDNPLMVFVTGINEAKSASIGPLTLFKLNAPGTPYPGTNRFFEVGGVLGMLQPFAVDSDSVGQNAAVQYIILEKGSPALTPLTEAEIEPE